MNRSGRITRRGDGTVRTLLYEAANVLLVKISRTSALRSWGLAIAQRSGFKKAKVAVARKLAVLLHRLWRDGTEFRWSAESAAA
jgi:transposase